MQRTIIAVADATRARLFTFDGSHDASATRDSLSERTDLVNPARHRTPSQLFSDTRTNTNRTGGKLYGLDDHCDAHIDGMDAEFASAIVTAIEQAVRDTGARRVILCAAPRLLGLLRRSDLHRDDLVVDELARDYAKLTATQIRDHLVARRLIPAPPRRPNLV